jgi:DNA-binding response OmpR family regulator
MTVKPRILLIDDDALLLRSTELLMSNEFRVSTASTVEGGISAIKQIEGLDGVVVDLDFAGQDRDGTYLLDWVAKERPTLPVVVLSGDRNTKRVVETAKRTGIDFIPKGIDFEASLKLSMRRAIELRKLESRRDQQSEFRTRSPLMKNLIRTVDKILLSQSQIPILILSVRDREDDKVKGLECGADDYLTKPFGAKELVARLRVLLRKHVVNRKPANLDYGRLQIDKEKRQVTINGAQLKLSDTEYKLLLVLADNPGKLFTHRELLRAVWEGNVSEHVEYLRVYINHLRQKLEEQPSRPVLILTEPGIGYRFRLTLPQ